MKVNTKSVWLVMLIFVLLAASCGQTEVTTEDSSPLTNETKQEDNNSQQTVSEDTVGQADTIIRRFDASTIEIMLDENFAAKETIGADGGSFSVTDANGIKYTLIIPVGALLFDELITMTPIANVDGEVISEVFQAGVKLEPEGLHFLELVSIEITAPAIEEGAVGFNTQSGEENFHLIPSITSAGSLVITTTHFTEFGISKEMVEDIKGLSNLFGEIKLEHELASGNDNQKLAALNKMIDDMLARGEAGININNWESWSTEILSLILRIDEIASKNKWDADTPGFKDLMNELQQMVDLWFKQSDGVMQEISKKCNQGEVAYLLTSVKVIEVGSWLTNRLTLKENKKQQIERWREIGKECLNWEVTWQARVLTTGSNFTSDISLGAERNLQSDLLDRYEDEVSSIVNLEVEYIEGFFDNLCEPKDGKIDLLIGFSKNYANLGMVSNFSIEGIKIVVKIMEDVFIDCGQGFSSVNAHAQRPFHGAALDRLNSGRIEMGDYWAFLVDYNPGGGIIAQFEEGPLSLNWSDGQYELWQLVTLYNATPPN